MTTTRFKEAGAELVARRTQRADEAAWFFEKFSHSIGGEFSGGKASGYKQTVADLSAFTSAEQMPPSEDDCHQIIKGWRQSAQKLASIGVTRNSFPAKQRYGEAHAFITAANEFSALVARFHD